MRFNDVFWILLNASDKQPEKRVRRTSSSSGSQSGSHCDDNEDNKNAISSVRMKTVASNYSGHWFHGGIWYSVRIIRTGCDVRIAFFVSDHYYTRSEGF